MSEALTHMYIEQKPLNRKALQRKLKQDIKHVPQGRLHGDCRGKKHGPKRSHILGNCRFATKGGVIWNEV